VRLEKLRLPLSQKLTQDYVYDYDKVSAFYTYDPYLQESWHIRHQKLQKRTFSHREQLVEGLRSYNLLIGNHRNAIENIEKLLNENTYAVVTGQQAGILTGPLYTIYKALTLLRVAREQAEKLGTEIVPVFWIAGEDHDVDEANHVYVMDGLEPQKLAFEFANAGRASVSHLLVDTPKLRAYIDEFFAMQLPSEYTVELKGKLYELASLSETLSDFFARTMAWLLGEQGLILVDSALPFMRELEKKGFSRVIRYNEEINQRVMEQGKRLLDAGYHMQVETSADNAQFFLYREGERVGVERLSNGMFQTRDGRERYSAKQLLALLDENPQQFSANVVSRPLMQEVIFPTLAYVGGPGEISYWGLYKDYFELLDLDLPILLPRMGFSLLDHTVQKHMNKHDLNLQDIFFSLREKREEALKSLDTIGIEERFAAIRAEFEKIYIPLIKEVEPIEKGLLTLGQKNLKRILDQVAYYERKVETSFVNKNDVVLRHFDRISTELFPMDKPQERVYNIFGYLNRFGMDWFRQFISFPYEITGEHFAALID
jgi:bacillithiol synthase